MANTEDLEAQHDRRVGTTLAGKYLLLRVLGAGGMGAVYEAENAGTGRRVAVKVMHPAASANAELTARFLREARASTRIGHPNIVEVLDLDRDATGTLYIVQEFLVGNDLGSAIRARAGEPFSPSETLEILAPVMRALVAAHAQKVVHRDLKPDNVFLARGADGRVTPKLIDFGIAKLMEEDSAQTPAEGGLSLTRTGMAMGTPYYMSPEQARGERSIDVQTDVWAIGVVLFEMLAGRRPFEADNYNALMVSIIAQDAPRVESVRPGLSPQWGDVVAKALARDRRARFATMEAFVEALVGIGAPHSGPNTGGFPVPPMPGVPTLPPFGNSGGTVALGTTLGQSAREITNASVPSERVRRRTPVWIAAAVLVIGGVGTWLAVHPRAASGGHTLPPVALAAAPFAPSAPINGASAPAPPSFFRVLIRAEPPGAVLALDGTDTGANTLVRELPRDGRSHRVTASAPGYVSRSVDFQDASPPEVLTLDALPATAAARTATARPTPSTRPTGHASPAAGTAEPPSATAPSTTIHPRGVQVQRDYP